LSARQRRGRRRGRGKVDECSLLRSDRHSARHARVREYSSLRSKTTTSPRVKEHSWLRSGRRECSPYLLQSMFFVALRETRTMLARCAPRQRPPYHRITKHYSSLRSEETVLASLGSLGRCTHSIPQLFFGGPHTVNLTKSPTTSTPLLAKNQTNPSQFLELHPRMPP
jgi:hypothetical protein